MLEILFYLAISLIIQLIMFIPAFLFKTDKLTDLSYSLSFIILGVFAFFSVQYKVVKLILLLMILLWALRLGGYLFYRINKLGKDTRFDNIRNSFFKFLGFWVLQGISVFVILINSLLVFNTNNLLFNYLSLVGLFIFILGLSIEGISDIQKFNFKQKNKDIWINEGLWKYSRHPNYFGEMLCWIGIFVFSSFYLNTMNIVYSLISPLFIVFLLLFVSGIPTLEKKYDHKFKDNPDYLKYKQKTNFLFPIKLKK
jgi:steroid 5-alpha reductase family enzyme